MSGLNEVAAASWAEAIRHGAQAPASPGKSLIIRNRSAPPFSLRALSPLAPVSDENWAETVLVHRPVVAHCLLVQLARMEVAAHISEPEAASTEPWKAVTLRTIEADIDYAGYGLAPDGSFPFRISFDLNLLVKKSLAPPDKSAGIRQ